eukprot:TRINITY_DN2436_c0_g1_i1.p1 TRINITY_DN2436_c0_g1~~TRINITY_DN2436_c0_g1_i1.p1  ORF type:complete len:525 (-),score=51.25 TRINITY_DN2436_c0_g1_i1:65-1639(-)
MEASTYDLMITLVKGVSKRVLRHPWPKDMRGPKLRRARQKLLDKAKVMSIKGNKLYCKIKFSKTITRAGAGDTGDREVPRAEDIKDIIAKYHVDEFGFHLKRDPLKAVLQEKYKWCHMKKDIEEYLQKCPDCASDSIARDLPAPPLRPIVSRNILERVEIDFTFLRRDFNTGDDCILTVIDTYSKFAWAKACKSKHAAHVAKFLYKTFMNEGFPLLIQSDNGKEFINKVLEELRKLLGAKQIKSAPRHPQTNGQIERFNQTLKRRLKKLTKSKATAPWVHLLPAAVRAYNEHIHSAHHRRPVDVFRALVPRLGDENSMYTSSFDWYLLTTCLVDFEEHARFAAELQQEVTKALQETGDRVLVDKGVKNRNRQEVKLLPAVIVEGLEYGAYTVEWLSGINKGKRSDEDCHLIRSDPKADQGTIEQSEALQAPQVSHEAPTTASQHLPNKKKRKFSNVYEDLELSRRSAPLEDIIAKGVRITKETTKDDDVESLEVEGEDSGSRSDTHQWKLICAGVMPLPKRRRL